jgi:hypothetical protein
MSSMGCHHLVQRGRDDRSARVPWWNPPRQPDHPLRWWLALLLPPIGRAAVRCAVALGRVAWASTKTAALTTSSVLAAVTILVVIGGGLRLW